MSEALSYGERLSAWIVRQHFHIPPAVFWAMALGGTILAPFLALTPASVCVAVAAMGVYGVLRWRWHRRRTRFLIVAQPVTVDRGDALAKRAQDLLMEALLARLTPEEAELVHPIPARIGPTETELADAVRRRLGGAMIVVGRIDRRSDGGWSLFSGVVKPPESDVWHLDWHTRERLPGRARWQVWQDRLTPTRDVQDVQEPLLMTGEIEAIVRSFAGYVASFADDLERAERELRAAIAVSDESESPIIDELRCELAGVLVRMERREEAVDALRQRAQGNSPSPELLRTFARYLGPQPADFASHFGDPDEDAALRTEALAALRAAADVRSDPRRPMSLYNLAAFRDSAEDEAREALTEAMRTSRYYRKAWYARRARGAEHWAAGQAALAEGDADAARDEFRQAARWYSAALITRPRFRLWFHNGPVVYRVARFPPSAILHANAQDAHRNAGHHLRAAWHRLRVSRIRRRLMRRGRRFLNVGEWQRAYANFDFAVIGREDFLEAEAAVLLAVCLQQMDEEEAAAAAFAEADARFPEIALIIRHVVLRDHADDLPNGVPGDGPTDEEGVAEELRRRGFQQDHGDEDDSSAAVQS